MKLFYTIEHDIEGNEQDGLYATGNKEVTLYDLSTPNAPRSVANLDLAYEDNTLDALQEFCVEELGEENEYNFVRL